MSYRHAVLASLVSGVFSFSGFAADSIANAASVLQGAPKVKDSDIPNATKEIVEASTRLWNSLTDEQKLKAGFMMKDEERFNWNFVPIARKGLPLKDMTQAQRHLAYAFMSSTLSARGVMDALAIMSQEQILYDMEKQNAKRDPEMYHVLIFGKPDVNGSWAIRWEGHHLSFSMTMVDGKVIAAGPAFWGTNPGEVREGPRKGLRVLGVEELAARELVNSFNEEQKKAAIIEAEAYKEILTTNKRKAELGTPRGLPTGKMNDAQQTALATLTKYVMTRFRIEVTVQDWNRIEKAGWDKVFFAWAGSTEAGKGHYYRIHGPTFLIEYDNTQNNANHVHLAFRDLENDFGGDVLKKHYDENPNDHGDVKP
jgi:hypothetical protein